MPPRITIDTRISESPKVKLFGATKPVIIAYTAPGQAGEEIAQREGGDLPARDVDAERGAGGLVQPHRVQGEADPGALEPPHQHERDRSQASATST